MNNIQSPALPIKTRVFICLFAFFTSFLLIGLQPCLNPTVRECKLIIGIASPYNFYNLINMLVIPTTIFQITLLAINFFIIAILFTASFIYCKTLNLMAIVFPACYFGLHLVWFGIFKDGFIPLNCTISSLLVGIFINAHQPLDFKIESIREDMRTMFIQEKINYIKYFIKIIVTVALAITGSAVAFNYGYMEKVFKMAGSGNYELALYIAQRQVATIMIWHVLIFLVFVLPRIYKRIDDILDLSKTA